MVGFGKDEETIFFLKPMVKAVDADDRWRQIRTESEIRLEIFRSGFRRTAHVTWCLAADDLLRLYPDLTPELWKATREHLLGAEVTVVLLGGEPGIIERFADYTGREVEPAKCAEHTVRYRFGSRTKLPGGGVYWENAIHRPKTKEEAERDIKLFFGGG